MKKTLVIVARDRPELYEQLAHRYGRLSRVRVMLDRRSVSTAEAGNRRQETDDGGLSTNGYIVTMAR